MENLTLGLDVGSQSIGWALIESNEEERTGRVVAAGVRVFPEGVDRDQQGGEKSKSQTRRVARGMRRQIARRANRKRILRQVLIEHGLLPTNGPDLEEVLSRDPYELRERALRERIEPFEIGRILLHLAQRRGFLSNRKTDRKTEAKGLNAEISALQTKMDQDGSRTLGTYLHRLGQAFSHRDRQTEPTEKDLKAGHLRDTVRRLHTRRAMYVKEFEDIWAAQEQHHPKLLTPDLKWRLYDPVADSDWVCKGLIFGQRRMYWPKAVVGRCDLEPKHKRCLVGERCAQRFRILQEVNNLKVIDRSIGEERRLTGQERATLIDCLSDAKERKFDDIRNRLKLPEYARFNLEGPERTKLKGHITDASLGKAVGKKAWAAMAELAKDAIARVALEEEHEEEALLQLTELGLNGQQAEAVLAAQLPEQRASFSREAIQRLLPHLEDGKFLMGNDESDSAIHAAGYLRPDQRDVHQRGFLPPAPDLPNPLVRQAMIEVRKVVNAILREVCDAPPERGGLGGRRPNAVHVELAREAKKSFEERKRLRFDNAERQRAREDAAARIEEYRQEYPQSGVKANPPTIRKYLLWKEQGGECPYSGQKISMRQLFSESTDIDHILPRWRSLDDSMMNKVVCLREENQAKGQRTPREWLEGSDPAKWERVVRAAEKLSYPKYRRFLQAEIVLDEFVNRQLQDTAYISRAVTQYLRCLGVSIVTPRGGMTAELRRFWGLNSILSDDGEKNRADHRHHAVDAAVIALTTHRRLHALANERGQSVTPPWPDLRQDLASIVQRINVSHRALRRIHGSLHEAMFYGCTQKPRATGSQQRPWARDWVEATGTYVRRRAVSEIDSIEELEKVRDHAIRLLLKRHLEAQRCDLSRQKGKLPKGCFEGKNAPRMLSGVPIRRVRMLEDSATLRPVSRSRSFQFAKPGKNHHIVYYEVDAPGGKHWVAEVMTMWDAATRASKGQALIQPDERNGRRFVMSLSIGEAIEVDSGDSGREIWVVREVDQTSGRLRCQQINDARSSKEVREAHARIRPSPEQLRKLKARKILVDPIGRIRWVND